MNVHTKTWARPLALFIALTMIMMYSFGGVVFADGLTNYNENSKIIEEKGNFQSSNDNHRGGSNDNDRGDQL